MGNKITVSSPKISTYAVSGDTLKDVWDNILKKGPKDPNDNKKVAAITETWITISDRWDPESRGGRCLTNGKTETRVGVKNMSMTIESAIKLPKLGSTKMSAKALKEWKRFMAKLESHEREHIDVTAKLAKTMGDEIFKIEGVGLGDDEDKAFEAGKAAFLKLFTAAYDGKSISDRISKEAKKFDSKTGHGAKHGALLNLDIT